MAVDIDDPAAPSARAVDWSAGRGWGTCAPVAVVLPGYERFVAGAGGGIVRLSVGRFANGERHVTVPERVGGRRCVVIGSVSPPAGNLERLTLVAHALRRAGATWVTAMLPYLAYARQDRAGGSDSLGLAWVGELLRASGINEVVCVDAHSVDTGEVLGLPLTSLSPAAVLAAALSDGWCEGVTFVAPDEGAIGRCAAVANTAGVDRPIVWAPKRRTLTGVEHLGLIGSPTRRAVVVDDILDTGSTLVSCCRQLRDAGVSRIGVMATHGLFTGERWRALLAEGVEQLWITDTVRSRRRPDRADVLPVAALFAPILEPSSA